MKKLSCFIILGAIIIGAYGVKVDSSNILKSANSIENNNLEFEIFANNNVIRLNEFEIFA